MICRNCGRPTPDNSARCVNCGFVFRNPNMNNAQVPNNNYNATMGNVRNMSNVQGVQYQNQGNKPIPAATAAATTAKAGLSGGAIAGIVIGAVALVITIVVIIVVIASSGSSSGSSNNYNYDANSQYEFTTNSDDNDDVEPTQAPETIQSDVYDNAEEILSDYALGFTGGWMQFRGYNGNLYFAEGEHGNPGAVHSFNKSTGEISTVKNINNGGKWHCVALCENGFVDRIAKDIVSPFTSAKAYDYNGNDITGNANEYTVEYNGSQFYYLDYENKTVEKGAASGQLWNTEFELDLNDTKYYNANIHNVFTAAGKSFACIFMYDEDGDGFEFYRIVPIDNYRDVIVDFDNDYHSYYLDGDILYYLNNGAVYKVDLSSSSYNSVKVCDCDATWLYFVLNDRVYYGTWTGETEMNVCYKDMNTNKETVITSGRYPMD